MKAMEQLGGLGNCFVSEIEALGFPKIYVKIRLKAKH